MTNLTAASTGSRYEFPTDLSAGLSERLWLADSGSWGWDEASTARTDFVMRSSNSDSTSWMLSTLLAPNFCIRRRFRRDSSVLAATARSSESRTYEFLMQSWFATIQNLMGSINFFKPVSTFLKPVLLINLSNFKNFSSEASMLPLCYAAQDISILVLIKRPQDLKDPSWECKC